MGKSRRLYCQFLTKDSPSKHPIVSETIFNEFHRECINICRVNLPLLTSREKKKVLGKRRTTDVCVVLFLLHFFPQQLNVYIREGGEN